MAALVSLVLFLLLGSLTDAAVCLPGSDGCEAVTLLEAANNTPTGLVYTKKALTAEERFKQAVEKRKTIRSVKPGEIPSLDKAFSAIEASVAEGKELPVYNWNDFAQNRSMLELLEKTYGLTTGGYQGEVCDPSKKCCAHDPNWFCKGPQCTPESFRLRVTNLCDDADGPRCAPGADKSWCDGECACPTNCAHKCGRCHSIEQSSGADTGGSCAKDCHGFTCDELSNRVDPNPPNEDQVLTCHHLKQHYGCSCEGCQCPPAQCADACHGDSCDYWLQELNGWFEGEPLNCNRLREEFGCDCTGCGCNGEGGSGR